MYFWEGSTYIRTYYTTEYYNRVNKTPPPKRTPKLWTDRSTRSPNLTCKIPVTV